MNYTVNTLANLSGVSVRTLRFYNEIGLLKPAFITENGYRHYGQDQLLLLQQILFFRELGFELKKIQEILGVNDFDRMKALQSHKTVLKRNIKRMQQLIATVDTTINHLQGKTVKDKALFKGFDVEQFKNKKPTYDHYVVKEGWATQEQIEAHPSNQWDDKDWKKMKESIDSLAKQWISALNKNLTPEDPEVQKLTQELHDWITRAWNIGNIQKAGPNKQAFIGIGIMYCENPDFKTMWDAYHPKLAEFLAQSMKVFAEKNLK